MTLYMLFAGLGILIYTGVAYAEAAVSGISSAQISFGLQRAFFVSLSMLLAVDIFFNANPLLRLDRASAWRRRIVVVALVFLASSVAVLIAATGEPSDALTCAGECGTRGQAILVEAYLREAIENPLATVAVGFTPVMPTFQLTEEDLQALVEYVKSLSIRP